MPEHLRCGVPLTNGKRVKSGCLTCKLRKVKCDEGWPVCQRCQCGGRVCQGYGVWGGGNMARGLQHDDPGDRSTKSEPPSAISQPSLVKTVKVIPFAIDEQCCFDWYMSRSATKLPGAFVSEQWTLLMFQASTTEPSIRHAVLALGSAHMEEVSGASLRSHEGNDKQTLFTFQQYSKAINHLQPSLTNSTATSLRCTLITCALFIYMEFLSGRYTMGMLHLEHGLNLLQKCQSGGIGRAALSVYVDGWLISIFTRLLVQAKLFHQLPHTPFREFLGASLEPDLPTFRSTHHARRSLEHIMLRAYDLREQLESRQLPSTAASEIGTDVLEHQHLLQMELQRWTDIHKATRMRLPPNHNIMELFAYWLLRLHYHVAYILVHTCLDTTSQMVDQYESKFVEIIAHCIEMYKTSHPKRHPKFKGYHDPELSSPNSISDIGWISPLYFTATQCRNHRLRHQAVQLLESVPHKEGMWNAKLTAVVARKVIEIEEKDYHRYTLDDGFDKLTAPTSEEVATLPLPAACRLSGISIMLPQDKGGKLLLTCCRGTKPGTSETITKQYDLPGRRWSDIT